nr:hypothetical protein [Tanacetum cinerariifolium]
MAEPTLQEYVVNAQNKSNLPITSNDINIELSKEFFEELQLNAYHRWIDKDMINHISMVLKMIDSIYIPGVVSHQLRMKIFPLSLADEAKQWWINEGDGKITVWEELVEKIFCKFILNHTMEMKKCWMRETTRIDPLEFISQVNLSFDKYMKMDGRTKKVLFHAWMNGSWKKRRMDDSVSSSSNTTTDSFFKPYLITRNTEKKANKVRRSTNIAIHPNLLMSNPTKECVKKKSLKLFNKGTEVMKDKVSQEHECEEEVPLNNNIRKQSGDLVEMQSEVVEQGMDDHVPDEIDGAKSEHALKHVVKKGNLEFLVYKQVATHGGDELEDKGRPLKRKRVYSE